MDELKLIHMHTTTDKMSAEVVKGFLKSNNIKSLIKANPGPEGAFLGRCGGSAPMNPWMVYVTEDKAEETRSLLNDFEKEEK